MTTDVIEISNDGYTQINTVTTSFLAQNQSPDLVNIVVTEDDTTPPAADADPIFRLERHDSISDANVVGIIWAKSTAARIAFMGLKEG